MAAKLQSLRTQYFDTSGRPLSGGKLFFYEAGTDTKVITYSDNALSIANTNPIILGTDGRPEKEIFLAPDSYKVILTASTDTDPPTSPIWTEDDYQVLSTQTFGAGINSNGQTEHLTNDQTSTTYVFLDTDRSKVVLLANANPIAATLPQPTASTFIDGWYADLSNTGAGTVTITPVLSTINGASSLTVETGRSVRIVSDGTNYKTILQGQQFISSESYYKTGHIIQSFSATPDSGFIVVNGDSLGSASSGATLSGTDYEALFKHFWGALTDTHAPVSSGRGASAQADWDANKTLTMPDPTDRVPVGAGSSYTTGDDTIGATTVASQGTVGTSGSTTITTSTAPTQTLELGISSTSSGTTNMSTGTLFAETANASAGGAYATTGGVSTWRQQNYIRDNNSNGSHSHAGGTFTGSATSVIQPSIALYYHIKL